MPGSKSKSSGSKTTRSKSTSNKTSSKKATKRSVKKCTYVNVRGPKKGERCNANCYDKYCKNHNTKRKEYQTGYWNKVKVEEKVEKTNEKITQLVDQNMSIHQLEDYHEKTGDEKFNNLGNVCIWRRKILGLKVYLGLMSYDQATTKLHDIIKGVCNDPDRCKNLFDIDNWCSANHPDSENLSKEEIDAKIKPLCKMCKKIFLEDEYDPYYMYKDYPTGGKDFCNKCKPCSRCVFDDTIKTTNMHGEALKIYEYIPKKDKSHAVAKAKLDKYLKRYNDTVLKMKMQQKLMDAIDSRITELNKQTDKHDENSDNDSDDE